MIEPCHAEPAAGDHSPKRAAMPFVPGTCRYPFTSPVPKAEEAKERLDSSLVANTTVTETDAADT
jgi:hypothetical protein